VEQSLITHRFPLPAAQAAYDLLDQEPGAAVQVVFDYRETGGIRPKMERPTEGVGMAVL
jgi:hypothetical protein